jgi:hypothetical protein
MLRHASAWAVRSDRHLNLVTCLPCSAGTVLAAFLPSIPLAALGGWFGFSKKKEAAAFLRERGAVVVDGCLDTKLSREAQARQQQAQQQQQQFPCQ